MKTFIPFNVGQCLTAKDGFYSEGFSFHIPQGDALINKGSVFAFVACQDALADSQRHARALVSDYCASSSHWSVPESITRIVAADESSTDGYCFVLVAIKGNQAHIFQHGNLGVILYRGDDTQLLNAQPDQPLATLDLQQGDLLGFTTAATQPLLMDSELSHFIKAREEDLNHTAYGMVKHACTTLGVAASIALIEVADLPSALQQVNWAGVDCVPPSLTVGDTFEGLTVLAVISESHTSRVLRVSNGQREFALKYPVATLNSHASDQSFSLQEWVLKRLDHPSIIKPIEREETTQTVYCLTEYLEARSLRAWYEHDSPTLVQVLHIIQQLASALLNMHRSGIYHRGITADNCLIDHQEHVYIVDMGSAYISGVGACGDPAQRLVNSEFLPPELAQGEQGGELADQYMLAKLAIWLCQRVHIPAELLSCLKTASHQKPSERYGDMGEFIHALNSCSVAIQPSPVQSAMPPPVTPTLGRYLWPAIALLLGLGWLMSSA